MTQFAPLHEDRAIVSPVAVTGSSFTNWTSMQKSVKYLCLSQNLEPAMLGAVRARHRSGLEALTVWQDKGPEGKPGQR